MASVGNREFIIANNSSAGQYQPTTAVNRAAYTLWYRCRFTFYNREIYAENYSIIQTTKTTSEALQITTSE